VGRTNRLHSNSKLRVTVYRLSFRIGTKPLEIHDQIFFQLNLCSYRMSVTSSLTRICLAFVKCTYRTYNMLLKILPFAIYASSLSVQAFTK
jgi:hypothetical protein